MTDYIQYIAELLQTGFAARTLIAGTLVAVCSALLGLSLVLKRCSMIGDGLSHAGFGAMGIAVALGAASPLAVSIPLVLTAAFFLLKISGGSSVGGDAPIEMVSAGSLAVGVVMLSRTAGNADLKSFMFGSILAVAPNDFLISVLTSSVVLVLYILFFNRAFAVTFDEDFSKATGTKAGLYRSALAALTAVVIVMGMRIMGAMLISGLIVFPALTAMRVFGGFRKVAVCAAVTAAVCFNAGIILSYVYDRVNNTNTPAGASVVLMNVAAYAAFWCFGKIKRRLRRPTTL